jgi:hypothetical protein
MRRGTADGCRGWNGARRLREDLRVVSDKKARDPVSPLVLNSPKVILFVFFLPRMPLIA